MGRRGSGREFHSVGASVQSEDGLLMGVVRRLVGVKPTPEDYKKLAQFVADGEPHVLEINEQSFMLTLRGDVQASSS